MPSLTDLKIIPPVNDALFEELCCELWKRIWGDPGTLRNGRNGQSQKGVDVYGRPNGSSEYAGVQAKAVAKPLSLSAISREIEEAKTFMPALSHLIIATTAPKDANAEEAVRIISEKHSAEGIFSVVLIGWTDVLVLLDDYSDLIEKYCHVHTSSSAINRKISESHRETIDVLQKIPDQIIERLGSLSSSTTGNLSGIFSQDQRVRVFVTATLNELSSERAQALSAINSLRLTSSSPSGDSHTHTLRAMRLAHLEQSQVYIGIFWKNYGFITPGSEISDIEAEYECSCGKPQLIYIKEAPEGRDTRLETLLQKIVNTEKLTCKSFSTLEELSELIKHDLQKVLSDRFSLASQQTQSSHAPFSYLDALRTEMKERNLINRPELLKGLLRQIEQDRKMAVVGDPGVGKTYLLGLLGTETDAIYISLIHQTTQRVFENLSNHLSVKRGFLPQSLPSEEEARLSLQDELSIGGSTILVDHADQNNTVVQALQGLEFLGHKVVFAIRSDQLDGLPGMTTYIVPPFTLPEMQQFLSCSQSVVSQEKEEQLYLASKGNPLYLYFFTKFQIEPLPAGLYSYQQALWRQSTPQQQELMIYTALSHKALAVNGLHDLVNHNTPNPPSIMETKRRLDETSPLLKISDGRYELFHPYFEGFVRDEIDNSGLSSYFHQQLGAYSAFKGWTVAAAFHFLRGSDNRLSDYLLDAIPLAAIEGDLSLAEEFAVFQITQSQRVNDLHDEALSRYYLAQVFQQNGRHHDADRETELAIELFTKNGDNEWKRITELWRTTLRVEEGRAEEAIDALNEALVGYEGVPQFQAFCYANLSFAYLRASRFREGSEAAEQALRIFTEIGDHQGILTSLGNLGGCLGELDDYDRLTPHLDRLIAEAVKHELPRHEALGLNLLAKVQRHNNNPIAAQETLKRSIIICQKIGYVGGQALNTANLGNAYLDQKRYREAQECYIRSLSLAKEYYLPHQEAHALELLARLSSIEGGKDEAANLAKQALELNRQYREPLRIGTSGRTLALALDELGRHGEAADIWEEAAQGYFDSEIFDMTSYCLERAASDWNLLQNPNRAIDAVLRGVQAAFLDKDPNRINNLLVEAPFTDGGTNVANIYLDNLDLFLTQGANLSLVPFTLNLAAYFKQTGNRVHYERAVEKLMAAVCQNPVIAWLNALAVIVEQSTEDLLSAKKIEEISFQIASSLDHVHFRSEDTGVPVWTLGLSWDRPLVLEVVALSENILASRVVFAVALILYANQTSLEKTVQLLGGNQEDGFAFQIVTEADFEQQVGIKIEQSPEDDVVATLSEGNVPWEEQQMPCIVVLHAGYQQRTDWANNPGNRAFVWVIMSVHGALVSQCTHLRRGDSYSVELAVKAREFCQEILL